MVSYKYAELAKDFEFQNDTCFVVAKLSRELLCPQTNFVWGFFIFKGL